MPVLAQPWYRLSLFATTIQTKTFPGIDISYRNRTGYNIYEKAANCKMLLSGRIRLTPPKASLWKIQGKLVNDRSDGKATAGLELEIVGARGFIRKLLLQRMSSALNLRIGGIYNTFKSEVVAGFVGECAGWECLHGFGIRYGFGNILKR